MEYNALGLIGQERATRLLISMLTDGRFPPMLFAGPSGTGKRTAALLLAQAANCKDHASRPCGKCQSCRTIGKLRHPDVRLFMPLGSVREPDTAGEGAVGDAIQKTLEESQEYCLGSTQPEPDPKHRISIEAVRWLRREMAKPPLTAERRFFIIVRADRMGTEAANAFLKTLEEPQVRTCLILTTDRPGLLLDTIRSRCRLIRFSPLRTEEVRTWLVETRKADSEEAELAAVISDGSPGKAVRFLADPDRFLSKPALDFFSLASQNEAAVLATLSQLDRTPLDTVVFTLLFLYRQALLYKLGVETGYGSRNPAVRTKAERDTLEHLRRAIAFLVGRIEDCRLSLNRRLFLYTLLSGIKKS